jgi:hypothetical protein
MTSAGLIAALRERGLVAADAPPLPDAAERPWFVNLLTGIAGWVSGLFVILFLAIALDLNRTNEALIAGLVLLCVAWVLYALGRGRVFVDQLALALSIAGQLAVCMFLFEKSYGAVPVTAVILGVQLALFFLMPDRTARTLAAFFASIAWVFVVRFALRPDEHGSIFAADDRFHLPMFGEWTFPLEWLLTWLPPIALLEGLRRTETRWMGRPRAALWRPAIVGLIVGLALGGLGAEPRATLVLELGSIGRGVSWWALFPLLSIALAMFAAWNAFLLRSVGLSGLAIVAALAHLARFYSLYGPSLTVKSLIMLVTGIALLGAARLMTRQSPVPA